MATNNKDLAASIVELLGGSSNISTALHCVTRLRFNLRDGSLAKLDDIRQLKGVLGAQIKDGQYQIIIGPNVNRVYDEVVPLLDSSAAADKPSSAGKIKGAQVLDIITGIFSAILPALVAGGMLKGLLALARDLWRKYRCRYLPDPEHDLRCALLLSSLPAGHLRSTQVQGE